MNLLAALSISGNEVARSHWLFGAFFLAMILDELGSSWQGLESTSYAFPTVFLIAGAGMWGAAVFANSVVDAVVHSLWGDVLLATGVIELQRRRNRLARPWARFAVPAAIVVCGALFLAHSDGPVTDPASHWHVLMGRTLIGAGLVGFVRALRRSRVWLFAYSAQLTAFSVLLLTFPKS